MPDYVNLVSHRIVHLIENLLPDKSRKNHQGVRLAVQLPIRPADDALRSPYGKALCTV